MSGNMIRNATRNTLIGSNQTGNASKDVNVSLETRQRETAQYIADMILELRNMAKSVQLYQVMVPLEYSYYEAFAVANRVDAPAGEVERIRELSKVSAECETVPDDY